MNKVSKYSLKVFLLFHYSVTLWQHFNSKSNLHFTRNFQKTKNIIFVFDVLSLPPSLHLSPAHSVVSICHHFNLPNIEPNQHFISILNHSLKRWNNFYPPPSPSTNFALLHQSLSLPISLSLSLSLSVLLLRSPQIFTGSGRPQPKTSCLIIDFDVLLKNYYSLSYRRTRPSLTLEITYLLGTSWTRSRSIKTLQCKFNATPIFKHSDWLKHLSSQSKCLKK